MRPFDRSRGAPARAREEAPQPGGGGVVGILLCGGRSSRMGSDKARLELGGRELIQYPLRALREVTGEVLLACGSEARYADLDLPVVLDPLPDGGPLAGLVAGLEAARERGARWVVVLAVDLPRADAGVLRGLLERARERDLDACLLGLERGSQPTYGVYHVRCAAMARAALERGERRMIAFHGAQPDGSTVRIECLPAEALGAPAEVALNLNTADELARERATLAGGGAR